MSPLGRGPLWTRARLERVMCLRFGFATDQPIIHRPNRLEQYSPVALARPKL